MLNPSLIISALTMPASLGSQPQQSMWLFLWQIIYFFNPWIMMTLLCVKNRAKYWGLNNVKDMHSSYLVIIQLLITMEAYWWEVEPSVKIQKGLSEEVTYKWGWEECVGEAGRRQSIAGSVQREQGVETSDIREYGNLNHWHIIASGKSPLVLLILKWKPLLYVPKHHHVHQHSPYHFVLCGCLFTKLSTNYLLNYIFTCWSFPLSNEIHKNKHHVCLDHYCIICSWYSAGYVTSWRKCPTHGLSIQHCCVCFPACQLSMPDVRAEEARLTDSYRCQGMNAPGAAAAKNCEGQGVNTTAVFLLLRWESSERYFLQQDCILVTPRTKLLEKAFFIGCLPFPSHSLPDVSWAPLAIKPLTIRSLARGQLPEETELRWSLRPRWLLSQLLICFIKQLLLFPWVFTLVPPTFSAKCPPSLTRLLHDSRDTRCTKSLLELCCALLHAHLRNLGTAEEELNV